MNPDFFPSEWRSQSRNQVLVDVGDLIDESLVLNGSPLRRNNTHPLVSRTLFSNGMTLEEASVPRSSRIASRRRYLLRNENVTSAAPPSSRIVGQRRYLPRHEVQNVTRSAPPYLRSNLLRGDQQNDEVEVEAVVKLLQTNSYEKVGDVEVCCSICLEDFEEGEQVAVLPCDHRFHSDCVARWLARRNFCPVCKRAALS